MTPEQIESWMRQAIALAENGRGHVEPNPMVGCLVIKNDILIGQGIHEKFGEPHAEVNALQNCSESPKDSTVIVTLEPCCHHGKTPPCTQALIQAGISEIFVGHRDPDPKVDGQGNNELRDAGIKVHCGFLESDIELQNAGFFKRTQQNRPWVIAKYAMTMDGNVATQNGNSQWISNETCRQHVHQLRGQVDAIVAGSNTVVTDNPMLNARPPGPRTATRVIFDSGARISLESNVVQTADQIPVLLFVNPAKATAEKIGQLSDAGVEIISCQQDYVERIDYALELLADRGMTNVLLEGGSKLFGEFFQAHQIDELRTYIAPILVGTGLQPNTGSGCERIADGKQMALLELKDLAGNIYTRSVRKSWLHSVE